MERIVVIDTETGGFDSSRFSILSLGAVVCTKSDIIAEFEVYINEKDICAEKEALAVNNIDTDWLTENGLSPSQAASNFLSFLDSHLPSKADKSVVIAGHNTWYDVEFLRRLFRLAGTPFPKRFSHRLIDTSSLIQAFSFFEIIQTSSGSSDEMFDLFKIHIRKGQRHTALADARATAKLLIAMKEYLRLRIV